jgi:hypothetical protein
MGCTVSLEIQVNSGRYSYHIVRVILLETSFLALPLWLDWVRDQQLRSEVWVNEARTHPCNRFPVPCLKPRSSRQLQCTCTFPLVKHLLLFFCSRQYNRSRTGHCNSVQPATQSSSNVDKPPSLTPTSLRVRAMPIIVSRGQPPNGDGSAPGNLSSDSDAWWWSSSGIAARWGIVAAIFVVFLLCIGAAYMHAQKRMKKGLQPLPYHRVSPQPQTNSHPDH